MSIRQKILLAFSLSALLVILISSGMYYYLLVRDIRSLGRQQIEIAFDMMFDDFRSRATHSSEAISRFAGDTLSGHMFVVSVSQQQLRQMKGMKNWEAWRSIQEIISRLRSMSEATGKFASLLKASDVRVYDHAGHLMVLYQHGRQPVQGIYLPHAHDGTFLPLDVINAKSWYWQRSEDIPRRAVPGGVPVTYPGEIPDAVRITLSQTEGIAGIRFVLPVLRRDKMQGVCVVHLRLSAQDIERYSRYSQAYVNVFANARLSVGTLPAYREFPIFRSEPLHDPELCESFQTPGFVFSEREIGSHRYYQGKISFGKPGSDIVTVTASFPHDREVEKANKRFLPILSIALVLVLVMTLILSILLQMILIRPLNRILIVAHEIAEGKMHQEIQIASHDEIGKLADAFGHMKSTIENVLHDTEQLIGAVQSGQLDIRGNADAYSGSWRDLIEGTNSVIDAFAGPLNMAATCLDRLADGDIPEKITREYQGDFDKIRNHLNLLIDATAETTLAAEAIAGGNLGFEVRERSENDRMMQALNRMIQRLNEIMNEMSQMIGAVGKGKLDVRGNAEAFDGGWQELVRGVNNLIRGLSHAVSASAALRQEMALARKIQTSLLPVSTDNIHPDLEIAATMLPADQVGGDFYDITFDSRKALRIAIGDVSGHGVTPGLIMMMAQTIHTTVITHLECDARSVVVRVNEILYKNVHERLRESHFMTFTALKYLENGTFEHAGAHLRIIVYRRETGQCELIRTKGVYLNFRRDISNPTKNSTFTLEKGDVMVLYTDGLTEAETPDGDMLDIPGLVRIVEKHAHRNSEAMKERIMADVIRWCDNRRDDDMTLVIVKRKGVKDG